ncbi:hypothetical protein [Burkholderia anthina]|uniref:hypothetical protein n=1 Tax=Burkholderia anthina TaxID=179879 RepID=UPI0037C15818
MTTFMVADADGNRTLEAEQLATFAHYIQGVQYRFVVTKLPHEHVGSVTHRASGSKVCSLTVNGMLAALNDAKVAGEAELTKLIARHGEARVASVLRAAEA